MDLTISAPSSIPSGAPGTERREARVPGTARVVGRCCIPTTPSIARVLWRLPAGCCCVVMAWSSATCSCGRPCFPLGVKCLSLCGASRIAEKSAAEDLSAAFLGNNSLCLWRWNRSARCATFRPRAKPSQFLPPTRLTSWVFWFQASARRPLPEDLSLFATALPCRRRKEQESSRWPRHAEPPRVAYLLPHETSKSHF